MHHCSQTLGFVVCFQDRLCLHIATAVLELTLWSRVILISQRSSSSASASRLRLKVSVTVPGFSLFLIIKNCICCLVMVHAFNPRIWAEAGRFLSSEFEENLVSRENSRTVRASQGSHVLKIQQKKLHLSVGLCIFLVYRVYEFYYLQRKANENNWLVCHNSK